MTDENTNPAQTGDSKNDENQDYEALVKELEDSKTKLTELTQISQQALADLQNYKKRSEEEKAKFVSFANATFITNILPILDNTARATANVPEGAKEWADGIIAIFKQLEEILKAHGLETIVTAEQQFDPAMHEAVMTEAGPADKILREVEKGYKIADRVLRRSKVVVGNEKPAESPAPVTETTPAPETKKISEEPAAEADEPYA